MHRVVVTGAGGFVGGWVVDELRRRAPDATIVACYGRTLPETAPADERVALDLRDATAVEALIARVAPTALAHLAAISRIRDSQERPRETWDVNLTGTMNLAYAVLARTPRCRFVFAGSGDAYGSSFNEIAGNLDERAPLAPLNVYAATKAAADLMLGQMAADGLQALRLRPFNHIGPRQSDQYAATAFAAQIARIDLGLQPPKISVGNLDARRDVIDVRDVARAYATALVGDRIWPAGAILNIASGDPVRIGDMLATLRALATREIEVRQDPALLRPIDLPRTGGDSALAARLLGWRPEIPLRKTLADILSDWRARVAAES